MKKKIIIIAACVLAAVVIALVVWAALANGWFSSVPDMKSLEVSEVSFDTALIKWTPSDKDAELEISCKAKNGSPVFTGTVEDNGEFLIEGLDHGTEYSVRAVYYVDEREGESQRVSFETEYNPAAGVSIGYIDYWFEGAGDYRLDWWGECDGAEGYNVYWKESTESDWGEATQTVNPELTLPLLPGRDYDIKVVPTVEGFEGEAYTMSTTVEPIYIYADYYINDENNCEILWDSYDDIVYTVSCEGDGIDPYEVERGKAELELTPEKTHVVSITASKNGVELARWDGEVEMPALPQIYAGAFAVIDPWTAQLKLYAKGTHNGAEWDVEIKNGLYTEDTIYFDRDQTEAAIDIAAIPGTTLIIILDGKEYSVDMPQAEPFTQWTFERISFYAEPDYSGWDGNDLEELGAQSEFAQGQAIAAQFFIDAGGTDSYTRYFDQKMIVYKPDGTCDVVSNYENSVEGDWEAWHTWFNSAIMGTCEQTGTYTVCVFIDGLLAGSGSYTVS